MQNTINSDLIRGNINTIILKALFDGDRYGYDIVKEIEQKSSGQYKLKQPTLYSCLKRLEVQGFIRSYWGAKSSGGRRKYYTLTDMGRELFIKNQTEWEYSRTVIDKLISDREYDLSAAPVPEYEDREYNDDADNSVEDNAAEEETTDETEETANEEPINEAEETEEEPTDQIDTAAILSRLFESQQDENSYTDKLASEEYTERERVSADDYFRDYRQDTDEAAEAEEDTARNYDDGQSEEYTENNDQFATDSAYYFPEREEAFGEPAADEAPETETVRDAATANNFMSYRESVSEYDDDKRLLERDYKKVLGSLVDGGMEQSAETDRMPPPAYIPLSDEMAQNIARIDSENSAQTEEETAVTTTYFNRTNPKDVLDQGLTTITDAALRSTGDTVRTRVHDDKAAASYNTQYHYFSNKLLLVQYAILFGIMMVETIFTFLLAKVGLRINTKFDVWTYVISVIVALAFPVTAAIMTFTDPHKTKRFDYDFKNSMIFRIWIMICCLIIVYCANIFMGMPMSFTKEYLSSLLLPALFALDIPLNTVIFKLLHDTGKFNQTY